MMIVHRYNNPPSIRQVQTITLSLPVTDENKQLGWWFLAVFRIHRGIRAELQGFIGVFVNVANWSTHTSHYECSRYKENPELINNLVQTKARENLKRYMHYYERVSFCL